MQETTFIPNAQPTDSRSYQNSSNKKLTVTVYVLGLVVVLLVIGLLFSLKTIQDTNKKLSQLQNNLNETVNNNEIVKNSEDQNPKILNDQMDSTIKTPLAEIPQNVVYDDGTYSFVVPSELYISKDPSDLGVPYAQLKTNNPSSIQIDISSELELSCIEVDHEEEITINGELTNKVFYKGIKDSELMNCQNDNSSFRAIWIKLPLWIDNVGRPTLAIRYNITDEELALNMYEEILNTLKVTQNN